MKKNFLQFFLLVLLMSSVAVACIEPPLTKIAVAVYGLKVNLDQVRSLCNKENCLINDKEGIIVVRSAYDQNVALEIGGTFVSLQFPLKVIDDYRNDPKSLQAAKEFPWKGAIKNDLVILTGKEILEINDDEINKISSLAEMGKKIIFKDGEWEIEIPEPLDAFPQGVTKRGGCGGSPEPLNFPNEIFFNI